jgi:hypothetical protein
MTRAIPLKAFEQAAGTLIADSLGAIGSTWIESETAPATVDASTEVLYGGGQTLRFQGAAQAGGNAYVTKAVNLNLTGVTHITIALWAGEIIPATGSTVTVYFITSTPGTADLRSMTFTCQKPGWNLITRPVSVASSSGSPNWASIRQIRVRVDTSASVARDMAFGGLWMNKRNRAKLCLSFDDGYDDCLAVDTICAPKKIPVSYGVIPSLIDDLAGNYLSTAELTTLSASGYAEIVCHDVDRWGDDVFAVSGAGGLATRLASIRDYIRGFDPVGCDYAVYPEGDYGFTNQLWKTFMPEFRRAGFKGARMVVPTTVEIPFMMDTVIGVGDPLLVPAVASLNNTTSLAAAKAWVDTTIQYGANAFLYGHKLGAAQDVSTWIDSEFSTLIDYVAWKRDQGLIDVVFMSDWFEGRAIGAARHV